MKKMQILVLFIIFFIVGNNFAESRYSLAVNDLRAQGVTKAEALVISEQLRVELSKAGKYQLIERSQMKEILAEQGFQQTGCTNDNCAVEVGQLLGVKNILIGSLGKAGSYTVMTIRILDVTFGNIIVNESIRTKGGIDEIMERGVLNLRQNGHW